MREEEEEMTIVAEEQDRYFLSSLIGLASSPISSHLEVVHEHLCGTFPIDPAIST